MILICEEFNDFIIEFDSRIEEFKSFLFDFESWMEKVLCCVVYEVDVVHVLCVCVIWPGGLGVRRFPDREFWR